MGKLIVTFANFLRSGPRYFTGLEIVRVGFSGPSLGRSTLFGGRVGFTYYSLVGCKSDLIKYGVNIWKYMSRACDKQRQSVYSCTCRIVIS